MSDVGDRSESFSSESVGGHRLEVFEGSELGGGESLAENGEVGVLEEGRSKVSLSSRSPSFHLLPSSSSPPSLRGFESSKRGLT